MLTFSKYASWFFRFFIGLGVIRGVILFVAGIATTDLKRTLLGFVWMLLCGSQLAGLQLAAGLIERNASGRGGPESDPRKPPP